jgi:cytidyltransferase-like protein
MEKIVWTNGCFDILHVGHVELFKYAKQQGTVPAGLFCP